MPFEPQIETNLALTTASPKLMGVRISGTGFCAPENEVKNEDLAQLGYDSDWIVQRTGIKARRHIGPDEATSDLAIGAARDCLARTGVKPEEIDLILVATMTPDHFTPSTACLVQAALGCKCGAIDMNAACSGFMYALIFASQFVKMGTYQKVLVIGAESMSVVVDPQDKKTFPLFGDGASAALVEMDGAGESDSGPGILAFRLASVGELADKLLVPGGCSREPASQKVIDERLQFLKMDGRVVFKWAVRLIPDVVNEMLQETGLRLDEIDLIIPHQANKRIIDAAIESLDLRPDQIFMNLDKYGNTSAASVPISIHEAIQEGRIQSGSNVMLIGFGAGLTWGACVMRW